MILGSIVGQIVHGSRVDLGGHLGFWYSLIEECDERSCFKLTQRKFDEFVEKELSCPGDKKAADLIRKVTTNVFESAFINIAATGASFADAFGNAPDESENGVDNALRECLEAFRNCLRVGPVPVAPDNTGIEVVPGDEDSEYIAKVQKQVLAARKNSIHFIASNMLTQTDFWKRGGQASAQYQKSKFAQSSGEAGKQNSLVLLCAELFPTKELFESSTPHKDQVPLTTELKNAARWVMAAQGHNHICLLTDGRSKKVRRAFEDIVEEAQTDEQKHLDGCILYGVPLRNEIRFHKRKTFGGLANLEKLCGALPVPKVRMSSKERAHFSACGEKSTHATSYTNVAIRDFDRLSRLSLQDKGTIVTAKLPTYCEKVIAATGVKGHPLFWGEVKSVDVFVALFNDLNVDKVFDLGAGSGAAAMAAAVCGIGYEGLALNVQHVNWLNRVIDKAMFAIIADRTDDESKQLRTDLAMYFGSSIEEARQLMISDPDETVEDEGDEAEDGSEDNAS